MLDLQNCILKMSSVNFRQELHGEDHVRACDLKFEGVVGNDVLIAFHPELRSMLFKKNDQPDLVDQADPEALSALRFPRLGTLKYDWEGTGYTLTIDHGLGDKSNIVLGDCKLDGIRIDPMQGGSVRLAFRVICHPDGKHVDPLTEKLQSDVEISVTPPAPTTVQELFNESSAA
jgi:hypothetical protein